ncbi:hypothetical protein ASF20_08930 [Methylobacterium sp. Leaf88]|nr:hypothetical protein ASF20_08930 [Methylobacterium sp. Leaf88]
MVVGRAIFEHSQIALIDPEAVCCREYDFIVDEDQIEASHQTVREWNLQPGSGERGIMNIGNQAGTFLHR